MPSLIKGYEYDIFISYRQKDNKADKWVTHFVEALKDEIEATFKEDISIYFDENPHDGLLETHDVDQSLSEKIKVLVFIPIISQTYCDPNCFAWQKEFIAFRDFARDDELGLDLRLASGNICKRILPVRIHEISTKDQTLYEMESGGVMRPIDFVYKDSGVNRPLRTTEEFPEDNLNHTIYRNQVNKVANAIKEIIYALKSQELDPNIIGSEEAIITTSAKSKINTRTISIASFLILFLAITAVIYFKFYSQTQILSEESQNARVAIIPFTNNSNDPELDILGNMAADWIIKGLMNFDNIKVVSYETVTRNLATASIGDIKQLKDLSRRIGADKVIMGSYYLQGDELAFQTQVIDVKSGEVELVLPLVTGTKDNLSDLVGDLNQRVMTIYGDAATTYSKHILRNPPKYESYKQFHEGWKYFGVDYNKCRKHFFKAIGLDSTFFWPYYFISVTYDNEGNIPGRDSIILGANQKCKPYSSFQTVCLNWLFAPDRKTAYVYAKKMHEKDPKNYLVNLVIGQMAKYLNRPNEAVSYFKELDPANFSFHSPTEVWWFRDYTYCLIRLKRYKEALKLLRNVPIEHWNKDLLALNSLIFVLQNKPDKIFELIKDLENNGFKEDLIEEVYLSTSDWFELTGNSQEKKRWAKMAMSRILIRSDIDEKYQSNLARGYFNSGQFNNATEVYEGLSITGSSKLFYSSMNAICHIRNGEIEKAKQIIIELEAINTPTSTYVLTRINCALNENDLALQNLKEAFENDYSFTLGRYDLDKLLTPLHGYPAYEEFVKPKGQ